MNYLPFCGYWFYGGATSTQTAAFYSSWGLLEVAGTIVSDLIGAAMYYYKRMME